MKGRVEVTEVAEKLELGAILLFTAVSNSFFPDLSVSTGRRHVLS